MANVYSETTITLSAEEKDLFEKTIKKLEDIVHDIHNNTDLFVDADSVFACINDTYRQNSKKMPTVVQIWE